MVQVKVQPRITDVDLVLTCSPGEEQEVFSRIFRISKATGCLDHPKEMHPWLEKQFGSLEAITCQEIVKIANLVTFEATLFNRLRASRPIDLKTRMNVESLIIDTGKDDPLDNPTKHTPEDLFGRVKGKFSITASNVAKYDALHAIVIFNNHNPLAFTREALRDYIDTAWAWAQKAHRYDPQARYFFFMWNCLWKAGATLAHGHAQVMLGRDCHYGKIEGLRRAALAYKAQYGSSYFDDLYRAHCAVGCGIERGGVRVFSYLAPIKDKEVMLLGADLGPAFKDALYDVLACLRDRMNVTAFNLGVATPPLEKEGGWEDFPVLARVVDRGDPRTTTSDIGAMELYASSVVSSDPLEVARLLREHLSPGKES
ncbi:MAG: hypothetical protein KJ624_04620 [Chloroflexi bacterium]|nr:hypothetical protein [Chloroflexota bacterium]